MDFSFQCENCIHAPIQRKPRIQNRKDEESKNDDFFFHSDLLYRKPKQRNEYRSKTAKFDNKHAHRVWCGVAWCPCHTLYTQYCKWQKMNEKRQKLPSWIWKTLKNTEHLNRNHIGFSVGRSFVGFVLYCKNIDVESTVQNFIIVYVCCLSFIRFTPSRHCAIWIGHQKKKKMKERRNGITNRQSTTKMKTNEKKKSTNRK